MLADRNLTRNFTLHEMLVSQEASRKGFSEQYEPPEFVIENLEALCINILQPLRDAINNPIIVNSGYRCFRVNCGIGGATKSQHLKGQAADLQDFRNGNEFLMRRIVELDLPFDQVINEFQFDWIHVSFDLNRCRNDILEAYRGMDFRTKYRKFKF